MRCECNRCGQTGLTEEAFNKQGLCATCVNELEHCRKEWEESVDRAAKEMSDTIDAEVLKRVCKEEE